MEERCQAFLLLLANLRAQEGVSAFQEKQFEGLLHYHIPSFTKLDKMQQPGNLSICTLQKLVKKYSSIKIVFEFPL
jgi:hypothetical protein